MLKRLSIFPGDLAWTHRPVNSSVSQTLMMNIMETVIMERSLDDVPPHSPQKPTVIRPYESGDEAHWYDIHLEADKLSNITEGLFRSEFGLDREELSTRQFYLCHAGKVIGTASAWHGTNYRDGSYGRVHWVAVRPSYQGRGLSKPLLCAVLQALTRLGHQRAYLTTSRLRPVAMGLYKSFGYVEV